MHTECHFIPHTFQNACFYFVLKSMFEKRGPPLRTHSMYLVHMFCSACLDMLSSVAEICFRVEVLEVIDDP
jgi:hypothetical protein